MTRDQKITATQPQELGIAQLIHSLSSKLPKRPLPEQEEEFEPYEFGLKASAELRLFVQGIKRKKLSSEVSFLNVTN